MESRSSRKLTGDPRFIKDKIAAILKNSCNFDEQIRSELKRQLTRANTELSYKTKQHPRILSTKPGLHHLREMVKILQTFNWIWLKLFESVENVD
jgi:hypothetical protein